jgi:hypothetical protein
LVPFRLGYIRNETIFHHASPTEEHLGHNGMYLPDGVRTGMGSIFSAS